MSSLIRKALLVSLISVMFVFAGIVVGPINLRNVFSLLLLCYAVVNHRYIAIDKTVKLYFLFLVVLICCNIINGEITHDSFVRNLFGNHLSSLAVILALPCLLRTESDYSLLKGCIIIIFIVNGIFSILQFMNYPIGWSMAAMISPSNTEVLENAEEYLYVHDRVNSLNLSLAAGLMGFVVTNGYFNAVYLPIITEGFWKKRTSFKKSLWCYALLFIALIFIYVTQQRMAMICFILYFVIVMKNRLQKWTILIVISILIILFFSDTFIINSDSVGRFSLDRDNDDRMILLKSFSEFLNKGNILFGGSDAYLTYAKGQHNTFLDVWVKGGLISLIAFLPLYFDIFIKTLKRIIYSKKLHFAVVSTSIACFFFLLYSQTHSVGLQSGSTLFWVPYMIFVCIKRNSTIVK